jgi:hypothetical protein
MWLPAGVSDAAVEVGAWRRQSCFGSFARDTLRHYYQPVKLPPGLDAGKEMAMPAAVGLVA